MEKQIVWSILKSGSHTLHGNQRFPSQNKRPFFNVAKLPRMERGAAQCRMQMLSQAKSTMHELGLIYKGSRLGPSLSALRGF